ncbi:MAG: type-F conjugative transfer system secretin TraK [Pseudomonadota bacterium]|nr:type-F conjugative transfer system secretin TraK [Pseudomonadota bacterium]
MAILLSISLDAHAAQVVAGKPDDTQAASVSRAEPTLIRVEGQRIRHIFGAKGDFTVTPDKDAGTAYLKPTTEKQSISAFVSDDAGRTWKLLLSITDGPSDSIIIKGKLDSTSKPAGHDLARVQAIKRVLLALESDKETDMETRVVNALVPLWQESLFVLVKVLDGSLKGEKYLLTNTSAKPMVIDERELYRRGVVAVSVEKPHLGPAETTAVYVISEGAS